MTRLTIHYDGDCGLCQRLVAWLATQRQLIPLAFAPKPPGQADLIVRADSGETWQGDAAWIIVLWALDDWREWSRRLARPALLPYARQAFTLLSEHRHRLSAWLHLTEPALARQLATVSAPACASPPTGAPGRRAFAE